MIKRLKSTIITSMITVVSLSTGIRDTPFLQ